MACRLRLQLAPAPCIGRTNRRRTCGQRCLRLLFDVGRRSARPRRREISSSKSTFIIAVIWSGEEWTVSTSPTPTTPGMPQARSRRSRTSSGIGRFADQQALRFISEQQRGEAEDHADHDRGRAVVERIAGDLRQEQADRRGDDAGHRRAILQQHDERRRVLRTDGSPRTSRASLGLLELAERPRASTSLRAGTRPAARRKPMIGDTAVLRVRDVDDAFVDRHSGAEREHQHRDDEAPEIELAAVAERVELVGRPLGRRAAPTSAAAGWSNRRRCGRPRSASPTSR